MGVNIEKMNTLCGGIGVAGSPVTYNGTSLYGNFRQLIFTEVYNNAEDFIQEYNNIGIPATISDTSATTLFYLLYARYGNSVVASSDINQFKYKLFGIVFEYGPTWEKRLEIQTNIRKLTEKDILDGGKAIYNHSDNPSTKPSNDTRDALLTIDSQNQTIYEKNKLEAYATVYNLLETNVTGDFLDRFKTLFLKVVEPEKPLWYSTALKQNDNN